MKLSLLLLMLPRVQMKMEDSEHFVGLFGLSNWSPI